jgi:hypothetical protein
MLTIEVTGLKSAASTNTFVLVDAFDVSAPKVRRVQETGPSPGRRQVPRSRNVIPGEQ